MWQLITQTPETFKGGQIWSVIVNINSALTGIGYGLLVLFFAIGIFSSAASFKELQRPEFALRHFIRFVLAKVAVGRGMEIMTAIFAICGSVVSASMNSIGGAVADSATLPTEIVSAIEDVGFMQSIPLWLVSFLGSLFITVMSFILILTVYGRFFKKQTTHIFTGGRLMLDSITLLCAVGEIGEESVLDTIRVLHLLDDQPQQRHRNRKMWRIVLIAAIIAALLTACAVGYTIHQRRQIELKAALQIESNSVEGYTEYTETDAGTSQANKTAVSDIAPHIQLISSIQQGENQIVYFSVAPVTEEEAHSYIYESFVTAFVSLASNKPIPEAYWMNDSERGNDSSKNFADPAMIMLAANTDTKEAAINTTAIDPEQTKAAIMSHCYDAETQSLMLQSYVNRNNVDFSMPVYFSVRCLDYKSMRIPGEDNYNLDL